MLPSGSWLHLTIGFLFGIITTVFAIKVSSQINKVFSVKSLISSLALYSFSIAVVSFFYASALSGGLLIEWKLLGFPEIGDPAVKVLEIGYVQGKSGNIYRDNQGILERVDAITQNEDDYYVIPTAGNCGTLSFLPIYKSDIIDSKSACIAWGPGIAKVAYSIDSGGRVYSWWHGVGEFGGIEKIFFPIGSAFDSCVFGVLIILVIALSNFIKNKRRKSNPME
jgi:hypothetical protein